MSIQAGIPDGELETLVETKKGASTRGDFDASLSRAAKLAGIRTFIYRNTLDAPSRYVQRVGLHSVNNDFRPLGIVCHGIHKEVGNRQRIIFLRW